MEFATKVSVQEGFISPLYLTSLSAFRWTNFTMLPHLSASLITCNKGNQNISVTTAFNIHIYSTKSNSHIFEIHVFVWVADNRIFFIACIYRMIILLVGYIPSSCSLLKSSTHPSVCWILCCHAPSACSWILQFIDVHQHKD